MTDTCKIQVVAQVEDPGDPSYLPCSSPSPATEPAMAPSWHLPGRAQSPLRLPCGLLCYPPPPLLPNNAFSARPTLPQPPCSCSPPGQLGGENKKGRARS